MATSGPTGAGGYTVVAGSTWASQSNAQGTHDAAYATFTNTSSGGSGTIDLTTYGTWSGIAAGSIITGVSVDVWQHISGNVARCASITAQFYVGTTAKAPQQALTKSVTSDGSIHDAFNVTDLPTLAELQGGTCKVRVIFTRAAVTTACVFSLDAAEITVTYSPVTDATVTMSGSLAAAASIPAAVVREYGPALELSGFGAAAGIGSSDTVEWVRVTVKQYQSAAAVAAPQIQLWDAATAQIGATQAGTHTTTSSNVDTFTFTGVTYAQLSTLRVRVYPDSGSAGPGAAQYVDAAGITVCYSPSDAGGTSATVAMGGFLAAAGTRPAPTVTATSNATAAPAILAASSGQPAITVTATSNAAVTMGAALGAAAGLPAPAAAASATASPAPAAAPAALPVPAASASAAAAPAALATAAAVPAPAITTAAAPAVTSAGGTGAAPQPRALGLELSNACEPQPPAGQGSTVTTSDTTGPAQFTSVTIGAGCAVTFDNAQVRSGTSALKMVTAAGTLATAVTWSDSGGTARFTRFYTYLDGYPAFSSGNPRLFSLTNGPGLRFKATGTGQLGIYNPGGANIASLASPLPSGTWIRVEFDVTNISGTAGDAALRVFYDANLETGTPSDSCSVTGSASLVSTSGSAGTADNTGNSTAIAFTSPFTIRYDDLAVSRTATPGPGPAAGGDATTAPAVLAAAVTVPAPVVEQDATAAPAVLAAAVTVPAAAASSNAAAGPAALAATATMPAPAASANATAGPAVLTAALALPAPAAAGGATAAPAVLAAALAQPAAAAGAGMTAAAQPPAALAAFPDPVVLAGGSATATPAVLAAVAGWPPPAAGTYPQTSPALELSGFGTFTGITPGDTINSVTVTVTEHQSDAAMGPVTFELWDGTTARIGDPQTGTASTTPGHTTTATWTGVTYDQLATLRVLAWGNSGGATAGAVQYVDAAALTVAYTHAAAAETTPATVTATAGFPPPSLAVTAEPAPLAATAGIPAPQVTVPASVLVASSPGYPSMPGAARPGRFTPGGSQQGFTLGLTADARFPAVTVATVGARASAPGYATAYATPVPGIGTWTNPAQAEGEPDGLVASWSVV